MLCMIVSTHSPDLCPVVNPAARKQLIASMQRMNEVAGTYGVKVLGSWNDMPAHTTFMLVDTSKPEVLSKMALDLHLMDFTTSTMHPLTTMEESMAILQKL